MNREVNRTLARGAPVISVDTKKKELVGDYANAGRQWLPEKRPVKVPSRYPHLAPHRGDMTARRKPSSSWP
ncbi:MAG: hypothetical protein HY812_04400 [Planctomycetes bacterium]|nr:hypothetical protein [Planctomycetota bacterium]